MGETDGIQVLAAEEKKPHFNITPDQIYDLLSPPNPSHYFQNLGGAHGLAELLKTNIDTGLIMAKSGAIEDIPAHSEATVAGENTYKVKRKNSIIAGASKSPLLDNIPLDDTHARIEHFGNNTMPEPISRSIWSFILDALNDKILIMLIIAAIVEIGIGIYKATKFNDSIELIDGIAVAVAGNINLN